MQFKMAFETKALSRTLDCATHPPRRYQSPFAETHNTVSGSFMLSKVDGQRIRTGGISVALSGPDCRVLGGNVLALLIAAGPVQARTLAMCQYCGEGHDAFAMSHMAKVGRLFVQCHVGYSHSSKEHVLDDDVWVAGLAIQALLEPSCRH
ncbi:hypothetical protein M8C21_002710 [Ambrosia artemisiifolia]|uniref:AT-hook motif nuclear-localized protein n=1 Tax=Ambrosia artemisiifolia TaxID=4212 RepID=A0AAD5BJV5_AMBAR|nr:hypothetical protein M8C21_002710 [Ambrosia artemisiifolia]